MPKLQAAVKKQPNSEVATLETLTVFPLSDHHYDKVKGFFLPASGSKRLMAFAASSNHSKYYLRLRRGNQGRGGGGFHCSNRNFLMRTTAVLHGKIKIIKSTRP